MRSRLDGDYDACVAQHAVASLLAEAASIEVATPAILGAIGENLGWEVGALHLMRPEVHRASMRDETEWNETQQTS